MRAKGVLKCIVLFTLMLCMVLPVLSLTSCKYNREYDETEVLEAAERLLRSAEVLNNIYYGDGIMPMYYGNQNGAYYQADPAHLASLGIETLDDLVFLTERTFTSTYSQRIYSTILASVSVDGEYVTMARYYQKYVDDDPTGECECIMVYRDYEQLYTDMMVFDYSTLTVLGSDGDYVNLTVEALVVNDSGEGQTRTIELSLYEEPNGWRIDTPTYANYSQYEDYYEESVGGA